MKSHVRVVVIGGGVAGYSVLYHLTRLGWRDVMLIERSESTSGSTWHAAGLPHPERRHQHGRVAGLHHPPLPRADGASRRSPTNDGTIAHPASLGSPPICASAIRFGAPP